MCVYVHVYVRKCVSEFACDGKCGGGSRSQEKQVHQIPGEYSQVTKLSYLLSHLGHLTLK